MLLDELLADFDATRIEHRVIDGGPDEVYARVIRADFMRAWRENPGVRALFAVRGAADRVGAVLRRDDAPPPPAPPRMRLADLPAEGEWVRLGADPPREICFGAIGRFWAGETAWQHISAEQFGSFDATGSARIACNPPPRARLSSPRAEP